MKTSSILLVSVCLCILCASCSVFPGSKSKSGMVNMTSKMNKLSEKENNSKSDSKPANLKADDAGFTGNKVRKSEKSITVADNSGSELLFGQGMGTNDPEALRLLTEAAKNLEPNQQRLQAIYKSHDPQAQPFLLAMARNDYNPLAPAALYLLRYYPQKGTVNLLEEKLRSSKTVIRRYAINSLAMVDPALAEKKSRELFNDKDAGVRAAAVLVSGYLKDRGAKEQLLRLLNSRDQNIRLMAAWALTRCGGFAEGTDVLKEIARIGDDKLASAAILALKDVHDIAAMRVFYDSLFNPNRRVQVTAMAVLAKIPEMTRRKSLEVYSPSQAALISLRMSVLGYLVGKNSDPPDCGMLLAGADYDGKVMALDCLEKAGRVEDIPVLIEAVGDRYGKVRDRAVFELIKLAKQNNMPSYPDDAYTVRSWREWWLRQYRVLAAMDAKAMLVTPLGKSLEVKNGSYLDFEAQVKRITPGRGREMNTGAKVELLCGGYPLLLQN